GAKNLTIIKRWEAARQTALNADLGGAQFPSLNGLLGNLLWIEKISVGFTRAAAEGAELATNEADVGEINVAVHDVSDNVAGQLTTQQVRGDQESEKVVSFRIGEKQPLLATECCTILCFQHALDGVTRTLLHERSNIRPVELWEVLEFRRCAGPHRYSLFHQRLNGTGHFLLRALSRGQFPGHAGIESH